MPDTDTLPGEAPADEAQAGPQAAAPEATAQPRTTDTLLPLGLLMPSPTNPRKRFAQAALEEMAATVEVHGVLQPLLARPNPDHRSGDGRAPFEIVAGERRWRACRLLTDQGRPYPHDGRVPVIVRPLADGEVLALQALENIQRQDLHPLEEADHYWLMTTHPRDAITVEQVGVMIGKSPAYVYGRLGLRRLVPAAREAFFAGTLDVSKAMKVAAMPTEQQAEIVAHITTWGGEPMGTRAAERYIHDHFTLQLQSAPWSLADGQLVPEAGPCTECPKRSDRQPQLFADATDGDRCLDASCWATKRQAMRDWRLATADAEGYRVLRGDAAAVLLARSGALADGWHDLADRVPAHLGDSSMTVEQAIDAAHVEAEAITALQHPQRDTLVFAVPTATLSAALRQIAKAAAPPAPKPTANDAAADAHPPPAPAPKPAAAATAPAPLPNWDPLDDVLSFPVLPPNTKIAPAAVELFRRRAIARVAAGLVAHRAAAELRHRGAAMGALLPRGVQGLLVARLAQALRLSDAGDDSTLADAARLAGVASTPPAGDATAVACWALLLDELDASAMAWALLALTPDNELALHDGITWRATVASAAGIAPAPVEAQARQVVDERLRLELLTRATINTAKSGSKVAVKYRHPQTGETWTGRGLKPRWLKVALDNGAQLDDFTVAAAPAPTPVRTRSSGQEPRE